MATSVCSPIDPPGSIDLVEEEHASAARELKWLLLSLNDTLSALRSGLEECMALLDSAGSGSTLALSSSRSEALKGIITRVGNRITRGDMQVKMFGLPHTKGLYATKLTLAPMAADRSLILEQLTDVGNFVTSSLELLDAPSGEDTLGTSTDAKFVMERICQLHANVLAARAALKGTTPHRLFPYHAVDPKTFEPPLPSNVAFDLYVSDAALVTEFRTLDLLSSPDGTKSGFSLPSLDISSPFGFRERFAAAVGIRNETSQKGHGNTEADETFSYHGVDVKVRERIQVRSQDPSLMAIWAKLGGLERALSTSIKSLRLVMMSADME